MPDSIKILVVDDIPSNLEVVTEILSFADYTVATAISGKRALKRLETYRPNLILLDVQMPGVDGFEVCRRIKANPETADVPIIFITALSDTKSIVKGFSLGAVDYVSKPFQAAELLARIKTHLQIQSLNQQLTQKTTELHATLEQLQSSKLRQVQAEKMSALGNLVAGVAHEINNPVGFLSGSIRNAQDYLADLLGYLDLHQQKHPQPDAALQEEAEDIDLSFLREDFPKLLLSMKAAIGRINGISNSLRTFSRADTEHPAAANLHEGLDSTLVILKYRLNGDANRPAIEVVKDYGSLPDVECFLGQLNQVFMNILANAIDAFDEAARQSSFSAIAANQQTITIKTTVRTNKKAEPDAVEIRIRDNGKGMPEAVKAKVFDHLFTTKEVGKGTGLGLAIAQQIVTESHCGSLTLVSTLGQGTEFCIRLPITQTPAV